MNTTAKHSNINPTVHISYHLNHGRFPHRVTTWTWALQRFLVDLAVPVKMSESFMNAMIIIPNYFTVFGLTLSFYGFLWVDEGKLFSSQWRNHLHGSQRLQSHPGSVRKEQNDKSNKSCPHHF